MLGDFATALAGSSDVFAAAAPPAASTSSPPTTASRSPTSSPTPTSTTTPTASTTATATTRTSPGTTASKARPTIPPSSPPRARDLRALLATLFASRGTIMLTAGDEFGRTPARQQQRLRPGQRRSPGSTGTGRDRELEAFTAALAALRRAHPALADPTLLTGAPGPDGIPDVAWLTPAGHPKTAADWQAARGRGARHGARHAAATAGSPSSSTAAGTRSPSTCPPAPATPGRARPPGRSPSAPRAVAFVTERPGGGSAAPAVTHRATAPLRRAAPGP